MFRRGGGPFNSWEEAAIDTLVNCAPYVARNKDWSVGGALLMLEQYNGLATRRRASRRRICGPAPTSMCPASVRRQVIRDRLGVSRNSSLVHPCLLAFRRLNGAMVGLAAFLYFIPPVWLSAGEDGWSAILNGARLLEYPVPPD